MDLKKNLMRFLLMITIPVAGVIMLFGIITNVKETFADMTYKLITDSDGITWQYGYNPTNKSLEVSFFESSNSLSEIVIPDKTYFIDNDGSINNVDSYIFTNYVYRNLGTPPTFSSNISKIDLSNVDIVNGVAPLLNRNQVTEIILNSEKSQIGYDVFREAKIDIKNLDKVISIGGGTFYHTTFSNTIISLPNLVSLGSGSFETSNVTSITLNYKTVGVSAFKNCKDLVSVVLLDNVTVINNSMFEGDSSLSSFDFNHVKTVNNDAFRYCTSWNIDIKDTEIEYLGTGVFWGTTGFTKEITIPSNVTYLGWRVFYGSHIKSVNLNNVTFVYSEAFKDCPELSNVEFGKVEQIEFQAFMNDSKLSSIQLSPSVFYVATQAFENCMLDSVDFGNVERINYRAFANNNLTEVSLPKSIVWMEPAIFNNNTIKKMIIAYDTLSDKIPEAWLLFEPVWYGNNDKIPVEEVELIAPYQLDEDPVIVSSHYSVNRVYKTNFADTSGLGHTNKTTGQSVSEDKEEDIKYGNVNSYRNVLQTKYLYQFPKLKKMVVGDGYEFLGSNSVALYNYSYIYYQGWIEYPNPTYPNPDKFHLANIQLPSTLKGIGINAFSGVLNTNNISINLPESLEYIGRGAFRGCWGVKNEVDLPNLKYLGDFAFQGTGIAKIALRNNLEYVGRNAFNYTENIKTVIVDCDYFRISSISDEYAPEFYWDPSYNDFGNSIHIFKYNEENSTDYKYDLIQFTENVKTLPKDPSIEVTYNSRGRTYAESYPLLNSLFWLTKAKVLDLEDCPWTEMVGHDFQEIMVETLKLPKNLTKVNDAMFYKARVANPVVIPDSVTYIGESAFAGSTIILENNLPSGLEYIGTAAFYNSKINDDLIVPESVTYIGRSAFATCANDIQYRCVSSYTTWDNDYNVHRNSITFLGQLGSTITNGQTISQLLWHSSFDEIKFGDNVTELPTNTMNAESTIDASTSEFWNTNVKKVTFGNLKELPKKAFIHNESIEEIDLSEDPNLESIEGYAFFATPNLNKVNLYYGSDISVGGHAFHGSGLTDISGENSGLDIKNNKITLDGEFTFAFMPKLKNIDVTSSLNEGVIPKGTFYSDPLLETVILEDDIKELKEEAFAIDNGLKTFVMYGDTKINDKGESHDLEAYVNGNLTFYLDTDKDFTILFEDKNLEITPSNFSGSGNVTGISTRAIKLGTGDKTYTINNAGVGTFTFKTEDDIYLESVNGNEIHIKDIEGEFATIDTHANLYCYLVNPDCNQYAEDNRELKEENNSDLYYLDEVLYLGANKNYIKLNEDKTEPLTDDLILYALRRDGILMVSDIYGQMTDNVKYVDSGITIKDYDASTTDPRKMVFNTSVDPRYIDSNSNDNFENIEFEIGEEDPETGRANVDFIYTNIITNLQVDTVLKTKGNYVDIIYADGCGGESFANVVYEDVEKGGTTPIFTGPTPEREGYRFIGWDKDISPTADDDVTYTAVWEIINVDHPEINKDPNPVVPGNNGLNVPDTAKEFNIFIPIILIILLLGGIYIIKRKSTN